MSADRARSAPIATMIAAVVIHCDRETLFHTIRSMAFGTLRGLAIPAIDRLRTGYGELFGCWLRGTANLVLFLAAPAIRMSRG